MQVTKKNDLHGTKSFSVLEIEEHPCTAVLPVVPEEGPGTGDLVAGAAPLIARETELNEEVEPAGNIDHYSRPDAEVVGIRGRHATIIIGPSAEIIADIGKQVRDVLVKRCGDADVRVHVEGRSAV